MDTMKAEEPLGKTTKIFAVYDDKAENYGYVHMRDTESLALRDFADEINNPQSPFNRHPADYRLYRIGTFNMRTGVIVSESPARIGIGSDFVESLKK